MNTPEPTAPPEPLFNWDLRDHFAGLAMQTLLLPVTAMLQAAGKSEAEIQEGIASMAYEMADAMLARRVQP